MSESQASSAAELIGQLRERLSKTLQAQAKQLERFEQSLQALRERHEQFQGALERQLEALATAIGKARESGDWRHKPSKLCDWCSFLGTRSGSRKSPS